MSKFSERKERRSRQRAELVRQVRENLSAEGGEVVVRDQIRREMMGGQVRVDFGDVIERLTGGRETHDPRERKMSALEIEQAAEQAEARRRDGLALHYLQRKVVGV